LESHSAACTARRVSSSKGPCGRCLRTCRGVVYGPAMQPLQIGIVGDFDRRKPSHWATEAALFHAAARLGMPVEPRWLSTPSFGLEDGASQLAQFDGVWGAPGSPFASTDGMLRAIRYAREHDLAYLGTCAGFQYALIEYTRNVLGIADADSSENAPQGANIV